MPQIINAYGQPVGESLKDWKQPMLLESYIMEGRYCRLEPLEPEKHGPNLYKTFTVEGNEPAWTYLPYGPFSSEGLFQEWLNSVAGKEDPAFFAIVVDGEPVGLSAYIRIQAVMGSVEIGHIHFSPVLQQTPAATEALYLLIRNAFTNGYRRCEWKCDSLNEPSKRAAQRLGFTYEGTFRKATIYKGRNRDTAWFSIIDGEWSRLDGAFQQWLAPSNFDPVGMQRRRLQDFNAG